MRHISENLYWDSVLYKGWTFYLAATIQGLYRILLPNEPLPVFEAWLTSRFPRVSLLRDEQRLSPYTTQLKEYFCGQRQAFDIPLDLRGTSFQMEVWRALIRIPHGKTKSYSEIAGEIKRSSAVRAVGAANGANPIPIVVPCHRVIGKSGSLTGYRGGLEVKEALLRLEGVQLPARECLI